MPSLWPYHLKSTLLCPKDVLEKSKMLADVARNIYGYNCACATALRKSGLAQTGPAGPLATALQ